MTIVYRTIKGEMLTHEELDGNFSHLDAKTYAKLTPPANTTTAIQLTKADGTTSIVNVDTTNSRVGIGTTTPSVNFEVKSNQPTSATLSAELITNVVDRDFSGAGNWAGTDWSVAGGVLTHTASANAVSLANTNLTEAIVSGATYQVVFTINTTTAGTLTPSVGGKNGVVIGKQVNSETQTIVFVSVTNTNPLTFTPDAAWVGTIDNVSLMRITPVSSTYQILNSVGDVCSAVTVNGLTNSFLGANSGTNNTSGASNTAMGLNSLYSNTSGASNTAMGLNSLYSNTSGASNTAMGLNSLRNNTSGTSNTASGRDSLYSNTTGGNNTSSGHDSLRNNTSGTYNTASGANAGRYQADGITGLTAPQNSCYIGAYTKGYNNSDDNTIVIGYNAIGKGANTTVLGNSSITDTTIGGNILPYTSDTYDIGSSTLQYDDIYATNATIQTSDARLKEDIVDLYVSTPFLEKLRPISFKWKDYTIPEETTVNAVHAKDENGNLLYETITEINEAPRQELVHQKDEDGNLLYETITEVDADGVETTRQEPVMIEETIIDKVETTRQEPIFVKETVVVRPEIVKTHTRKHCGLIAQEVEQAILDIGMTTEDFAALCYDSETDRYSVRYTELIPVLIRGWQDQQAKIKELEARLIALENK